MTPRLPPQSRSHRPQRPGRRAFTLVEASLSVLVLSLIVVASLEAAGAGVRALSSLRDREFADRLADSLLSEIIARPYATPTDTTGLLATLGNAFDRANFLSVASYAAFTESPPRSRDGTTTLASAAWSRAVSLSFVSPTDPTLASVTDAGLVRITVTVSKDGRVVSRRSTLRALD